MGDDDDDPPEQVSAPQSPPLMRCFQPPATQHPRDTAHHGCADYDDPAALISNQSRSAPTLKNGFHHTLSAVFEKVNRLFLFVTNVIDVSALTTDTYGHSCHERLFTRNEGRNLTVALRIRFPAFAPLLKRFDASTLQVQLLVSDKIISVPAYLQTCRRAPKAAEFATHVPNAPPLRPAPKPYPTGPHQSVISKPPTTPASPGSSLCSNACGSCYQGASNKPPPRPAPTPYPTGPHQSVIKKPNKPPPRPAPNPYPTGPHQS